MYITAFTNVLNVSLELIVKAQRKHATGTIATMKCFEPESVPFIVKWSVFRQ